MTKTVDSTGVADELTERYYTGRSYRRQRKRLERDGWRVADELREPWTIGPVVGWADASILSPLALLVYLTWRRFPSLRPLVFTVRYARPAKMRCDNVGPDPLP